MVNDFKEVQFDQYCKICEYGEREERMDPCNECLETGMREETSKPMFYKENDE